MRQLIKLITEENAHKVQELFDQVAEDDPKGAIEIWIKLCSYIVPKPAPENIGADDDSKVTEIEINIIDPTNGSSDKECFPIA